MCAMVQPLTGGGKRTPVMRKASPSKMISARCLNKNGTINPSRIGSAGVDDKMAEGYGSVRMTAKRTQMEKLPAVKLD